MKKSIAIIGGGPAGLMAAEILSQNDVTVDLYESMPSLGRKFLMAGKSGLNLTHAEPYHTFITRYGDKQKQIETHLNHFKPDDLLAWVKGLGIETFIGSSGRIFPKEMKASPLLRAWLKRLQANGVTFHTRHHWKGWKEKFLIFDSPAGFIKIKPDATILALGGASWPKLGSRGEWVLWLEEAGISIEPFYPANCGFIVNWSKHFSEKFHGHPMKSVVLSFKDFKQKGDFVLTRTGMEGSLIYAASAKLRDALASTGTAVLALDLAPDISREKLMVALAKSRGSRSLSSHIKKTTHLSDAKIALLYEFFSKEDLVKIEKLADAIKALHIPLSAISSLEIAISSAGGVHFEDLNDNLMLRKMPGIFCAGEMIDWEAVTGGYLLTACFATGRAAGNGALNWLRSNK
ncbi:MAG: aminoacetone oxidase family FAD-binding enzyme [Gammaproteobacteria bacterium CG_4_10_14_0_8_um_filter_38_16]|nr:MAG: aminoacetone oxidase family FAD-binding enzyme [Gammaproteobacteria bacterium CG_4_10_14_0_8_um_filter_38_16]PJA03333.1 MAG: aminoacetone oxidase family FAD-binding enzyme [Gammaproteobacteria bacterium CG_4_10_14_0_2_um_filter_38_22]PJB09467.1 MAG: aminoacetone oxidase family FAD-binding enzyme [Gammaproteobacteria bacterium CG_4_9_14_3_um_filter_38_9]